MRVQGRRVLGRRMRGLIGATGLIALIGAMGAQSAGASASPISYAQAREWIVAPEGRYGGDPSSPGPSVVVNVPNAGGHQGYIEVWAQVRANRAATAVGLFDVTRGHRRFVDGQDTLCAQTVDVPIPGDLFLTLDGLPGFYGTPMLPCAATTGPPGPVLLRVHSGMRRFRLEYADCGCGPGVARVAHRRLWIRPAPTS